MLTAVENNTEQSHGFGKVLGRLCLASASWASRSPPQPIRQSCGQGHVTPVAYIRLGERCVGYSADLIMDSAIQSSICYHHECDAGALP